MTERRPLVRVDGQNVQLPDGDTVVSIALGGTAGIGGFDDQRSSPAVTFYDSGLGATFPATQAIATAFPSHQGGLRYFEVTFESGTSSGNCSIGVVGNITDFAHQIGYDGGVGEIAMFQSSGNIYADEALAGDNGPFSTVGDVVGVAVNDAREVWFRVNNGTWNGSGSANPITGVGGYSVGGTDPLFPAVGTDDIASFRLNTMAFLAGAIPWGQLPSNVQTPEDVRIESPEEGQALVYMGGQWVNASITQAGMLYRKQATFTSSQNWTFPATALPSVDYDIIGGGGAGGGSPATPTTAASAGGGGGGDRKRGIHELVPGETYAVVVGAGGAGSVGSIGGDGGDSMFDGITAFGGKGGGTGGSTAPGGAAGGGTKSLSAVLVLNSAPGGGGSSANRSAGSVGYDSKCSGGGAGGSAEGTSTSGGPGAGSGYTSADGDAATNVGCGGGGAGKVSGSAGFKGGDGFRGEVTITYWDTEP